MEISRYLVIFFSLCSLAWGTVNEPLRCEGLTGYRKDRIHWHLKHEGEKISQKKSNLDFWENALQLRVIHRDLYLFARGAYGFGKEKQTSEALGSLGYAVLLTPDRTYKVILIPFVGYGADYEWLPKERFSWFGPYLGGFFLVEPGGPLQLEAGYAYHRDHVRFHFHKIKIKDGGNPEHSGWIRLDYLLPHGWRAGAVGMMEYFSTRTLQAAHEEGRFKMRWTAVSGAVLIARRF